MTAGRPIGVLTGLASEVKLATDLALKLGPTYQAPRVLCAAADAGRAAAMAEDLCRQAVGAVLSFGIAGGLEPQLDPGSVVLAQSIVGPDGTALLCDTAWHDRVMRAAAAADLVLHSTRLAGVEEALTSPGEKQDLRRASGAAAVDMESLALARAATAAGLPFLALRAVADPARRGLPSAALAPLRNDGQPQARLVAARLAVRPWQLPGLIRLAFDARRAERALAALSPLAPALFGGF